MTKIDIAKWLGRIDKAEQLLNTKRQERLDAIKLYTGTFFGSSFNNTGELSEVNFLYEYVDAAVSALYARNPYIFVRGTNPGRGSFAETMEKVINYYWRELKMKQKFRSAIVDAILQPPGWIGLGYTFISAERTMKKNVEEEFPELKDFGKKEKVESEEGFLDETRKIDDVFSEHISSWNVLIPDGYHNIRECPYIIVKQKISYEDVMNNPMFKDCKDEILSHGYGTTSKPKTYTMKSNVNTGTTYSSESDNDSVNIDLYHVWDRRGMQVFTVCKQYNKDTLFEKEWDYFSEGFPFFPLIFNEVPATDEKANAYPLSDAVPMFPQLKELSLISSAMMRHRKRSGTLILGRKLAFKDTDVQKIQSASDVDFIQLDDISENSIKAFLPPPLPSDFYRIRDAVLGDLYRISGYEQLLGVGSNIETATESENIRAGAVLRQSKRVDIIEEMTVEVSRFLAGLLWQYKSKKQIQEIIGEEVTDEMWLPLPEDKNEARKIIQKELNFRIDAGSMRPPKDEAIERKQWSDLASVIKANFPNRLKEDEFLKQLLKKYNFNDMDKIIISSDDEETAVAQKENELLLKGVPQVVGPNENHMIHLQVHAQAYQVPGMQITDQMNQHIIEHEDKMRMKNPSAFPQKGDSKLPTQSNSPDQSRQGVTAYADLVGEINSFPGSGGEKGKN